MSTSVAHPEVWSAVRSLLIAFGGYAIGKDWLDMDTTTLSEIVGAILVVGPALWGIWAKRPRATEAQVVAERVAVSPEVPHIVKKELAEAVNGSLATRTEPVNPDKGP